MKKFLTLIIAASALLFLSASANAQSSNGFTSQISCSPGDTYIRANDANLFQTEDAGELDRMNQFLANKCLVSGNGPFMNASSAWPLTGTTVQHCPIGFNAARSTTSGYYDHGINLCCPTGSPYVYNNSLTNFDPDVCCPSHENAFDIPVGNKCPGGQDPVPAVGPDPFLGYFINNEGVDAAEPGRVSLGTPTYFCALPKCVLSGSTILTTDASGYTEAEIASLTCLDAGVPIPGDTANVCFNGIKMDAARYQAIGGNAIQACAKLTGQDQIDCGLCFQKNIDTGNANFVYSSIGCVDTSRDGLITRIFQIGIGVMTGVILLRFIQSAILRLSAEPDKIQEAYDITNSSIIALITLAGAVVILRIIGINVLQIFPTNFLQ